MYIGKLLLLFITYKTDVHLKRIKITKFSQLIRLSKTYSMQYMRETQILVLVSMVPSWQKMEGIANVWKSKKVRIVQQKQILIFAINLPD